MNVIECVKKLEGWKEAVKVLKDILEEDDYELTLEAKRAIRMLIKTAGLKISTLEDASKDIVISVSDGEV